MTGFAAVVLAAGTSSRFGGVKLLQDLGGRPLIAWALEAALRTPAMTVVLVTGAEGDAVAAAARAAFPSPVASKRLIPIRAPAAAEGMGASLRCAVAACPPAEGLFVFLGDMPAIPAGIPEALIAALQSGADAAAPVWAGKRGHPVLFGPRLRPALLRAQGDRGMQDVLADPDVRLARVCAAGDGVLLDVDTPEALERAQRRLFGA